MQLPRLAIVDLETTGADPARDRITEIAILITDGEQLIEQWSSLIDPEVPIPARIQAFVGITDDMVKGAPTFEQLAGDIRDRLSDVIFVAHNARFDFNFLRNYYERRGEVFDPPSLCTVKLSRALDPQYPRHGLDAIIERAGYQIESRHRALDDAVAVWHFLTDSLHRHENAHFERAWARALSRSSVVPRLPTGDLEALPTSPGIYILYGVTGKVLQISHARDLRSQVLGMFTSKKIDSKTKRLAAQVQHVEIHRTTGELDTLLTELQLQRQHGLQDITPSYAWRWRKNPQDSSILELLETTGTDPADWQSSPDKALLDDPSLDNPHDNFLGGFSGNLFGNFRGEREAHTALKQLANQNRLCHLRIGLEHGPGPCQAFGLGKCSGVCAGKESPMQHDLRLMQTLASLRLKTWPYAGPVSICEGHESPTGEDRFTTHLFDQWCHLGRAENESNIRDCLQNPRRFDADIYRLLQRWLAAGDSTVQIKTLRNNGGDL